MEILFIFLFIFSFFYIAVLRPHFNQKKNNLIFDNLVLGFIDGLYYSGIRFYCTDFEMRRYVRDHLAAAHKLPENKHYFEHTTPNGYRYCSRLIPGEHQLFALLCLAQYAKEYDHSQLLSWCETKMNDASHAWSSWRNN